MAEDCRESLWVGFESYSRTLVFSYFRILVLSASALTMGRNQSFSVLVMNKLFPTFSKHRLAIGGWKQLQARTRARFLLLIPVDPDTYYVPCAAGLILRNL